MPPLEPFEHKLAADWSPADWQDLGVLVAVSGGADSVALGRAMAALKRVAASLWLTSTIVGAARLRTPIRLSSLSWPGNSR